MSGKKVFLLRANPVCLEQHMDAGVFAQALCFGGHTVVDSPSDADRIVVLQCAFDAKHRAASDWLCRRWEASGVELERAGCGSVGDDDRLVDVACLRASTACTWRCTDTRADCRFPIPHLTRALVKGYKQLFGPLPETPWITYHVARTQSYVQKDSLYVRPCIGCKGTCTYCSIRGCRGSFWSFSTRQISSAIREADDDWQRMVVIGDDVGAWQDGTGVGFPALLRALGPLTKGRPVAVENLSPRWFRLSGMQDLGNALSSVNIERMSIPVQSMSDSVLSRMGRGYQADEALDLLQTVRRHAAQAYLSTHIICGFPGETDEDHSKNLRFVLSGICDDVRVFAFSPQPSTPAEAMPERLSVATTRQRYRDLSRASHAALKSQKQVVRRYFSGVAKEYRDVFHQSRSFQERLDVVKALLGQSHYQCAVDIGCGSGEYLPLLATIADRVVAVDYSPAMVDCAMQKYGDQLGNVEYRCAEPDSLGGELSADLLLVMGVLEYVDEPASFLCTLRSLTHEGSVMLLSYPNVWNPGRLRDRLLSRPLEFVARRVGIPIPRSVRERKRMSYTDAGYIRHAEFSQRKMAQMLGAAGFMVANAMDYNRTGLPGILLRRKALQGSGIVVCAKAI